MTAPTEHDPVSYPEHYTSDPSGVECIQITRHRNFNIGNAIKYLWRSGLKNTAATTEDLRKAVWYIEDEIARIEGQVAMTRPRELTVRQIETQGCLKCRRKTEEEK